MVKVNEQYAIKDTGKLYVGYPEFFGENNINVNLAAKYQYLAETTDVLHNGDMVKVLALGTHSRNGETLAVISPIGLNKTYLINVTGLVECKYLTHEQIISLLGYDIKIV